MNKRFSIILALVMVLSTISTNVNAAGNPFDGPQPNVNTNQPALPGVYSKRFEDLNQEVSKMNSENEKQLKDMEKQLEGINKVLELNNKIRAVNSDSTMSNEQKIKALKGYNNDLKGLLNNEFKDHANDPDFANAKKILDTNDRLFATIENKNMPDDQKIREIQKFQKEYMSIYSQGSVSTQAQGGERNADLRRSSRKTYANNKYPAGWTIDQPFFETEPEFVSPSMTSIKEKYHLGNFTGSMQEAEAYVRKNPDDTFGFYYLAMSYAKSGDRENAIKAYERVIAMNDSPIIVKYATNGRNCVMNGRPDRCYQEVNLPDYVYPYAKEATPYNLTPVDPDTLVQKNLTQIESKIVANENAKGRNKGKDGKSKGAVKEVFSKQDAKLDEFIKAPYGNGLSPELNMEIRKQQLKKLRNSINMEGNKSDSYFNNFNNVKDFDKNKSEIKTLDRIASVETSEASYMNDPEYIKAQKEMKQIELMFGTSSKKSNDIVDLLPSLIEQGNNNNISPEMMKTMVTNSIMTDMIDTNF